MGGGAGGRGGALCAGGREAPPSLQADRFCREVEIGHTAAIHARGGMKMTRLACFLRGALLIHEFQAPRKGMILTQSEGVPCRGPWEGDSKIYQNDKAVGQLWKACKCTPFFGTP